MYILKKEDAMIQILPSFVPPVMSPSVPFDLSDDETNIWPADLLPVQESINPITYTRHE